jgi:hypothetical protein
MAVIFMKQSRNTYAPVGIAASVVPQYTTIIYKNGSIDRLSVHSIPRGPVA